MSQPSASTPSAPLLGAIAKLLRQPRFLIAALVLGVSAVGLEAATQYLKLHFRKEPVPLRAAGLKDPSTGIPSEFSASASAFGRWVQISRDEPFRSDEEQALGTKQYVSRDYFDLRAVSRLDGVAEFEGKALASQREAVVTELRARPAEDRERFTAEVRRLAPEAIVRLHVAYYTGLVDTVAHIPDRCYVADGFEPSSYEVIPGPFGTLADGTPRDAKFRFISFEDVSGQGRVARHVAYLFQVNGRYEESPLEVRARLQNLLEKYGYYAKIELMVTGNTKDPTGKERALAAMKDFMIATLPEVERVLPDWKQVKAGGK